MSDRLVGLAVVVVCVVAFCGPALAQDPPPKPGPEHERIGAWLGKWTCETAQGGSGTQTCEWTAEGFFMVCSTDWKSPSGAASNNVLVLGYSKADKTYTWYRHSSLGWTDSAKN